MKKHMLALVLAFQLVASLATTSFAATDQVTYHVGSISSVGYLLDDDSARVDFSDSADPQRVRYGETVYFPLLNNGVGTATASQLSARSTRLARELSQAERFVAAAQSEYEQATDALQDAVHATISTKDELQAAISALLSAIENETADGISARDDRIKRQTEALSWQRRILDSAIELDESTKALHSSLLDESARASDASFALLTLVTPVEVRTRTRDALATLVNVTLDEAYDALEEANDDLLDSGVTTNQLQKQLGDATEQRRALQERIDEILDTLVAGSATEQNLDGAYTAYRDARGEYLPLLTAGALDSGAADYFADPAPVPGHYDAEVLAYCDAIKALLSTYQGVSQYDKQSIYAARTLADRLAELGFLTDRPGEGITLYEQLAACSSAIEELEQELALSILRDGIVREITQLEEEKRSLEAKLVEQGQQIAALVGTLFDRPDELTPSALEDLIEEWSDRIDALLKKLEQVAQDVVYYAAERVQEQKEYDVLAAALSALTDPNAPSAAARAQHFGETYSYLKLSQRFAKPLDSGLLDDATLLDELASLYEQLDAFSVDQGVDSDLELLQLLAPYQRYIDARKLYDPLQQDNASLAQSASAARLALRQADPQSEKYPYVYESKAVEGVRLKSKWDEGKRYVDRISLVKKRYQNDLSYSGELPSQHIYFIALTTKPRTTTATSGVDLHGTISMKKSSRSDSLHHFEYEDMKLDVNLELGFNHPEDANLIPIKPALFSPDDDFDQSNEETFDFEADSKSYYLANTTSQKKLVLGMSTDYDETIDALYAEQTNNLSYWNGNGSSFQRSGYLYLSAEEDHFLYRINDRGGLTAVNARYDEQEECFVLRTRVLGRYVISDVALSLIDPDAPDLEDETLIVVLPDQVEEADPKPAVPSKPPVGWSEGSRSDESKSPLSPASSAPTPPLAPEPEPASSIAQEEIPVATEAQGMSTALLVGAILAGVLTLSLIGILIFNARRKKAS